jgi:hypothetical protein
MTTIEQQTRQPNRDVFRALQELMYADEDLKTKGVEDYLMQTVFEYPLNSQSTVTEYRVLLDTVWDSLNSDDKPELIGNATSNHLEMGYLIAILDKGLTQENVDDWYGWVQDIDEESIEPIAEIFRNYNLVPGSF